MANNKTISSTLTKRRSIYWLSQALYDAAGNELVNEEDIISKLKDLPPDTFWAVILHDKDPDDNNSQKIKPPHLHIFIRLKENNFKISTMSAYLGIREEQFVLPEKIRHNNYRVRGLDIDAHCVQYMTHQHADQKAPYSSELIKTSDKERLEYLLAIDIVPPGAKEEVARALIDSITQNRTTLLDYISVDNPEFDGNLYVDKYNKLQNAEKVRLERFPRNIDRRIVIFVGGYRAKCGKTPLAVKLAEEFAIKVYRAAPSVNCYNKNPYLFTMNPETGWNGYKGQPMLLIDDIMDKDLVKSFGSSSGVKTMLDPHPLAIMANVKGGHVQPQNEFVFITSIYSYDQYMQILQSKIFTDEPIEQFKRRVAAVFYVATDDRVKFKINPNGFYEREFSLESIYFPVAEMMRQHCDREYFSRALAPCMEQLLQMPERKEEDKVYIDFDLLGKSPI